MRRDSATSAEMIGILADVERNRKLARDDPWMRLRPKRLGRAQRLMLHWWKRGLERAATDEYEGIE